MEYFESILLEAILRCDGKIFTGDKLRNGFWQIYPFTTENINGYIKNFDLDDKLLLTVGSSADQIINASLFNCHDITVVDINPYTKFYFYLKVSSIINLEYNEFCNFFCYKDYPRFCENNKFVFEFDIYNKIKSTLRLLDYESYLFWDELFCTYNGEVIRKNLFSYDEYNLRILKNINLFMSNEEIFNVTKEKVKKSFPKFIIGNIFEVTLDKKYDNIWLSNLGAYYKLDEFKKLVNKLYNNLSDNGKLLMCYLYETFENSKYDEDWVEIYNLKKVFSYFEEYNFEFINFIGIRDIIFENVRDNDAIVLVKKNRS